MAEMGWRATGAIAPEAEADDLGPGHMQQPVTDDSTFPIEALNGCQQPRHRGVAVDVFSGINIAGLDPATNTGFTAATAITVDRDTGKRHLIDVFNKQVRAAGLRQLIMDWTEKYSINEWRIEKNAFQAFLTQDREINQFLASRGVRLREHHTGMNKHDPAWGIASMDSLLRGWQDGDALLTLPAQGQNEAYRQFKEQLARGIPTTPRLRRSTSRCRSGSRSSGPGDATRHLGTRNQQFLENTFLSQNDMDSRVVINIDDYLLEQSRQQAI